MFWGNVSERVTLYREVQKATEKPLKEKKETNYNLVVPPLMEHRDRYLILEFFFSCLPK